MKQFLRELGDLFVELTPLIVTSVVSLSGITVFLQIAKACGRL